MRVVMEPDLVQLKGFKVSYLVNSKLQAQIDLFPCTTNTSIAKKDIPLLVKSFPNLKRVWETSTLPNTLLDFGNVNTYKPEATIFHLHCTLYKHV